MVKEHFESSHGSVWILGRIFSIGMFIVRIFIIGPFVVEFFVIRVFIVGVLVVGIIIAKIFVFDIKCDCKAERLGAIQVLPNLIAR
jgi:hypothetical protein